MKRLCDKCGKMLVWSIQDGLYCSEHGYNYQDVLSNDLTTKEGEKKHFD